MNTRETQELLDKALRKRLSEAEKSRWEELLRTDPALMETFAEESALDQALEILPNAPISSNFTALVVEAARREEKAASVARLPKFSLWRLVPRLALAGVVAGAVLFGYRNHEKKQEEMALNVRSFSDVAAAMSSSSKTSPAEVLANFDAIQRLSFPADAEVDMELLVALQK